MSIAVKFFRVAFAAVLAMAMLVTVGERADAAAVIHVPGDYATIQEAVDASSDGDTILVAAGSYVGDFEVFTPNLTIRSTLGAGFTELDLDGHGLWGMTIDQEAPGFTIEGFTITNGSSEFRAPGAAVRHNVFTGNRLSSSRSAIRMNFGGTVELNVFTDNTCDAIADLDGNALFANNLLVDNQFCSAFALEDGSTARILNNTIDNGRATLHYHPGTDAIIRNNIFATNRYTFLQDGAGGLPPGLRNNLFWNSPPYEPSDPDPVGWNGNIGGDPKFTVNQPGLLRHGLRATSPAIDAGLWGSSLNGDYFGGNRIVDGDGDGTAKIDLGAIEYGSGISRIKGTASYENGTPAVAACVTAFEDGGDAVNTTAVETDSASFSLVLPGGSCEVQFGPCGTTDLIPTWYGGATRGEATVVVLGEDELLAGIDATVAIAPSVTCNGLQVTILGTDEADTIVGTAAADVIAARAGSDDISAGREADTVCGGAHGDTIRGSGGADTLLGEGGVDKIFGGSGHDHLIGGSARDNLRGESGSDLIEGGSGADRLWGGPGADTIFGGSGPDTFYSQLNDGNDTYEGGPGGDGSEDTLSFQGTPGVVVDLVAGTSEGRGSDTLSRIPNVLGTPGADTLLGDDEVNYLYGEEGDDILDGAGGDDRLHGEEGNDLLDGGPGDDQLEGDDGDDTFLWNAGADRYEGDTGFDWLDLSNAPFGIDLDVMMGPSRIRGISGLIGSPFDDTLSEQEAFTELHMGPGNDHVTSERTITVSGGSGDDHIVAPTGSWLDGGEGNDTLRVQGGYSNSSTLIGGDGDDTLFGSGNEDWLDGASGADTIRGGSGADTILGGTGDDTLNGGVGSDLILGEEGNDTISGDKGLDGIIPGPGNDFVDGGPALDIVSYEDADLPVTVNLEQGTATGWGTDTLVSFTSVIGGPADDLIIGDASANIIGGGLGDDEIRGGAGDDTFYGHGGDDLLVGGPGDDDIDGGADIDAAYGWAGTDNCINAETMVSCETSNAPADMADVVGHVSVLMVGRLIPPNLRFDPT